MVKGIISILSFLVVLGFSFVTMQLFLKDCWTEGIISFTFLVLPALSVYLNHHISNNVSGKIELNN
ncbi:hypothetical protein [Peribacillus alkalitolerans]|uniref:hypothetical protein n=1 Tax=Peribacillus alkalitolerans TaxID=1550385 RepID=UPI0013D29F74|nr:hypothetical protein [Peribacillus alkalitolerans]